MAKLRNFVIVLFLIVLFSFLYILIQSSEIKEDERIVTKIVDGDTIIVEGGEKIRLVGIDCDERGKECYNEASDFLENEVLGKIVELESGLDDKDIYGRSLRYIFLNGENINVKLVKKGFCVARFEKQGEKYQEEIQQAEQYAILNGVGCKWS